MASGDLTASTPTVCRGATEIKAAIDALNLAAVTDKLVVVPVPNLWETFYIFKVERAA